MSARIGWYFLGLTLAVLAGCASAPRVDVARAPGADFTRFDTFTFHEPLGTDRQEGTSTILSQTLKETTRSQLDAKGYEYVEENADLEVNFFVETKEVISGLSRRPSLSIGYGVFHRHYGVWTGYDPGVDVQQYTQGTLHVDVIDAENDRLVWEGVARTRQPADGFVFDPERIQTSVDRVFADFPSRVAAIGD